MVRNYQFRPNQPPQELVALATLDPGLGALLESLEVLTTNLNSRRDPLLGDRGGDG